MALQPNQKLILKEKGVEHCIFKWSIKNFSLCRKEDTYSIKSPLFKFDPMSLTPCYLQLNPSKKTSKGEGVSIYLVRNKKVESQSSIRINVKFRIEYGEDNCVFEKKSETAVELSDALGFENVCNLNTLLTTDSSDKYPKDDVLDITCEILTEVREVENAYKCHTPDLLCFSNDIIKLHQKECFNDVIFNVNGGKVKANKLILSARSDILQDPEQRRDMTPIVIDLPHIDETVLKLFLSYLYSGDMELLVSRDPLPIGLYECAKKFSLTDLERLLIPNAIYAYTEIQVNDSCEYTWIIENFSISGEDDEQAILSPPFGSCCGNNVWVLKLYKRHGSKPQNKIAIFAHCLGDAGDNYLSLEISLIDEKGVTHYTSRTVELISRNKKCGFPAFIDRKRLLLDNPKVLFHDTLRVKCKLKLSDGAQRNAVVNSEISSYVNYKAGYERFSTDFKNLYDSGSLSDLTLETSDKTKFSVHKIILSARSGVFEGLIKDCSQPSLKIPKVESKALDALLKYIYSGTLSDVPLDIMLKLYEAADHFILKHLQKKAADILAKNFQVGTVCDVFASADFRKDVELKKAAMKYICYNAAEVLATNKWQEIVMTNMNLATEVLRSLTETFRRSSNA